MPVSGLVLLVASKTDGVFGGPTATSFTSGDDDVVVLAGDLSGTGTPGRFSGGLENHLLTDGLSANDPVQLYWFPTLTLADYNSGSGSPGAGTTYGSYRDDTGLNGSAPWVVPGDGSAVDVTFITASQGGSNSDALGYANHVIARPDILSLTGAGTTNVVITWSAASNLTYRVRYRHDFNSPWINLAPDVTATTKTASAADNPGGAMQRFYQVLLVP